MSDEWTEAWSRLTNAVEHAVEAGMTREEIDNTVDEAFPDTNAKPYVGGGPKKVKQ
jgi:hypothetical protein